MSITSASRFEWDGPGVAAIALTAFAMLAWAIVVVRIIGLRSLAKISGFDFVVTVALGSITASTIVSSSSLWHGVAAFLALLTAQWAVARLRLFPSFERLVDNRPVLLMERDRVDREMMRRSRITMDDLLQKLRNQGVTDRGQVLAVVLETTGDVSVLTGEGPVDPFILSDVRRSARPDSQSRQQ